MFLLGGQFLPFWVYIVSLLVTAQFLVPLDLTLNPHVSGYFEQAGSILRLPQRHIDLYQILDSLLRVLLKFQLLVVQGLRVGGWLFGALCQQCATNFQRTLLSVHKLHEIQHNLPNKDVWFGVADYDITEIVYQLFFLCVQQYLPQKEEWNVIKLES